MNSKLEAICRENPHLAAELAAELLRYCGKPVDPAAVVGGIVERIELSLVFPAYNEEENIPELYRQVAAVLDENQIVNAELLFVNNGSWDRTEELIRDLKKSDPRIKLINFSRNFGHQAAITAGIDFSSGDATVLMDADLQDPPHVITEMLKRWKDGAEIVYAVRQKRGKEPIWKKVFAFSFYRMLQYVSSIEIPLDTGDFCLLDRKVVNYLKALPERNRFLRGLRSWLGFRQVAVSYERPARFAGTAKYNVRQSVRLAINGIVGFSTVPLRVAVYVGFLSCFVAVLLLIYALAVHFVDPTVSTLARGWASLIVVILVIGGIQLILLGSIGEYIGRIYDEVKQRPNYVIRDIAD